MALRSAGGIITLRLLDGCQERGWTYPYLAIDGKLDEPAWIKVPKSPRFMDVIGGNPGLFDTRAALLWDDDALYIAFWCEEPYPAAHLSERDSLIWFENDLEVFIDGGDTYYEFEVNALNTVYEVFYIWKDAYVKGGRFDVPEFDILPQNALTFGGNHDRTGHYFWRGSHPRMNRWAFRGWDFPGLKTAVHIDGKLNDDSVVSKGWTLELAFPWQGMQWLANGRALPPKDGDVWSLFLGRYEKLMLNGAELHAGWSWDKIGTGDNHLPERQGWRILDTTDKGIETTVIHSLTKVARSSRSGHSPTIVPAAVDRFPLRY